MRFRQSSLALGIVAGDSLDVDGSVAQSSLLHTAVLRNWDAFETLRGDWNRLLGRSGADSVFLTWEWIRTWLDCGARRWQPFIVVVRDTGGAVVGIAPFYVAQYRLLHPPCPCACCASRAISRPAPNTATGSWRASTSPRPARRSVPRCTPCVDQWDCIWMPNVSGWNGALERTCRSQVPARCACARDRSISATSTSPRRWPRLENTLSANRRQQIRRKRRNLLKDPDVSLSSATVSTQLDQSLDDLFRLHNARWMTRGDPGTFVRKPMQAEFYRRFAPVALANGWLRLHTLEPGRRGPSDPVRLLLQGHVPATAGGFRSGLPGRCRQRAAPLRDRELHQRGPEVL